MSIEAKDTSKTSGRRFAQLQQLETIYLAAPHQYEMQRLVGNSVAEAIERIKRANPESKGFIEVVEIGIGKGFTSEEILKASEGVKVTGVDNDAGMMAQAAQNLTERIESGRLELHQEDARDFLKRIPDGSVEVVASALTIHNFEREYRKEVLREIFRILKPGGEFITADKIMPDDKEIFQKETEWQIAQFEKIPNGKVRREWIKHYEEDLRPDVVMREDELAKMLQKIGFEDISITDRKHLEALARAKK